MDYELLGWPEDGPTLRLDYREFSYAGKFVMSNTGKAVAREDDEDGGEVVGAIAFNADRTDDRTLWLRYVTVRADRRGEGIGPELVRFVVGQADDQGYDRARIAVNNPFAYEALYKAGFVYTGEGTGIAELVLERTLVRADPPSLDAATYQAGLDVYRERDGLSEAERDFLAAREDADPPAGDVPVDGNESA